MKAPLLVSTAVAVVLGTLAAQPVLASDPVTTARLSALLRMHRHAALAAKRRTPVRTVASAGSTTPDFTFFDMPSSTNSEAGGINLGVGGAAPRIVGCYVPNDSTSGLFDGFEYSLKSHGKKSTATFEAIGATSVGFCPSSINDAGVVVGSYYPDLSGVGVSAGFVMDAGTVTQLNAPFPNACETYAAGVNDAGTVVGFYEANVDCSSQGGGWSQGSFTWVAGTYTALAGPPGSIDAVAFAINSAGDIVGGGLNATETADVGWLLQGGVYTQIMVPGAATTQPYGVNDSDAIVGTYCVGTFSVCQSSGTPQGFLFQNGTYTTINVPGALGTYPWGINNKGEISGEYEDANGYWHSFLIAP
jgi:hypothetical protein